MQPRNKMFPSLHYSTPTKTLVDHYITEYLLPIGLFVQLTSIAWAGRSSNLSLTNIFLMLPGLILLLINSSSIKYWKPKIVEIFLILFLVSSIISMSWSDSDRTTIDLIKRLLSIFIYIYSLYRISEKPEKLIKILILSSFVMSISALAGVTVQYFIFENNLEYRQFRIYSTGISDLGDISNPILAGLYYTPFASILFTFFCFEQSNTKWKKYYFLAFLSIFFYILLTWSRGPWIAFTGAIFSILLLIRNRITNLILSAGGILLIIFLLTNIDEIYRSFVETGVSNRSGIWSHTINKIIEKPLLGHGWNSSFSYTNDLGTNHPHPHSLYLKIFYDLGMIGGFFFISLIISSLFTAYVHRDKKLVLIAIPIIISGCIGMLTDISEIITRTDETWIFFWLPLGLIISSHIQTSKNKKNKSDCFRHSST